MTVELATRRAACTGIERALLEQIEADPKNTALLLVYADWLESTGWLNAAAVVRARL